MKVLLFILAASFASISTASDYQLNCSAADTSFSWEESLGTYVLNVRTFDFDQEGERVFTTTSFDLNDISIKYSNKKRLSRTTSSNSEEEYYTATATIIPLKKVREAFRKLTGIAKVKEKVFCREYSDWE
ncbi:MAG TPA: hypothetical protein VNJ01_14185 [Bacteriovoracaceae bacterium]|nr:hypothetical protein [Bacteriovoracaceae bacterium]